MFQLLLLSLVSAAVQHNFMFGQSKAVQDWLSEANEDMIKGYVSHLTNNFTTRHAKSAEGLRACQWVNDKLTDLGFNSTLVYFRNGFNPNVVATMSPDGMVPFKDPTLIVGAHLDDREKDINKVDARAPGANDDGSGSSAVLTLATLMAGKKFKFPVAIMFFNAEEYGLLGSAYMATMLKSANAQIIGMIQMDMVGFMKSPSAKPGVALVNRYTDRKFTSQAHGIISQYMPDTPLVQSSACCSDHQSFLTAGFRSIGIVEPGGYAADPMWHNINDTMDREGYSVKQILQAVRAVQSLVGDLAQLQPKASS